MNEIQLLTARARKYLCSSGLLINAGDYESAVSRAYYAMFFVVQAALLTEGLSASTHKGVISVFGERFIKTGIFPKSVARSLSMAFEKRQLGDYEYTTVIELSEAEVVLDAARTIVDLIAQWLDGAGPASINSEHGVED